MIECDNYDTTKKYLNWHMQRRWGGVPTVGVLVGTWGMVVERWKKWGEENERPVSILRHVDETSLAAAWRKLLDQPRDWRRVAAEHVAHRTQQATPVILRKSRTEIELLRQHLREGQPQEAWIPFLSVLAAGGRSPTTIAELLQDAELPEPNTDQDWLKLLCDLHQIIPTAEQSALLIMVKPGPDARVWWESVGPPLYTIAKQLPDFPVAVGISLTAYDDYISNAPASRIKALLQEGALHVRSDFISHVVPHVLQSHEVTPEVQQIWQQLVPNGVSEAVSQSFVELVRSNTISPATSDAADAARSTAERFLYACLEARPATSGCFELNGVLPVRFGLQNQMEVDFLCRSPRIAVELDGYFHFQDQSAYRRDRRKDLALQQAGYLVLRFLAADVLTHLEEILETITTCLEQQSPS